jgi:ADP-ribose pyrophosphatase
MQGGGMEIFMDFTEKTIASKQIFDGRIISVKVDTVELPNGRTSTRELVGHPGGVGIVAVDKDRQVFLVRQFRKPFERMIAEIPAGKLEYGEDPLSAAKRELEEEIGYKAGKIRSIGAYYSSPGFCNETIHLYLATELEAVGQHPDEDEFLEISKVSLDELYKAVIDGNTTDGKTAIAILIAKQILG